MGISKRVYQRLRLIGYGTVPDFFLLQCRISTTDKSPHLPYPFRFSDTSVNNPSFRIQPSQNRTIPRKPPTPLPPLSKVRCCRPKKFGRLPEGLLAPLRFAPHSYRPLSKVRCCRPKNSGDYRRDCHTYRTLSVSLTPPLTISHSAPNPSKSVLSLENRQHPCLALHHHPCLPSKKGRWLDGIAKPLFYIIFIL